MVMLESRKRISRTKSIGCRRLDLVYIIPS